MIYSLYLYNRQGACLYNKDFKKGNRQQRADNVQLLYGLLYSLKKFAHKISPNDRKRFRSYKTGSYKLHCYETPTGLKLVMSTDLGVGSIDHDLEHIYSQIYVPCVVRNPLADLDTPLTPPPPAPSSSSSSSSTAGAPCASSSLSSSSSSSAAAISAAFDASVSRFVASLKYY